MGKYGKPNGKEPPARQGQKWPKKGVFEGVFHLFSIFGPSFGHFCPCPDRGSFPFGFPWFSVSWLFSIPYQPGMILIFDPKIGPFYSPQTLWFKRKMWERRQEDKWFHSHVCIGGLHVLAQKGTRKIRDGIVVSLRAYTKHQLDIPQELLPPVHGSYPTLGQFHGTHQLIDKTDPFSRFLGLSLRLFSTESYETVVCLGLRQKKEHLKGLGNRALVKAVVVS